jgi:outer membrane lipoprotein SlyB
MMTSYLERFCMLLLTLSLVYLFGCSGARRPVLYPNSHLQSVGETRMRSDVNQCMRLAEGFGAPVYGGTDIARDSAVAAAIGGAAAGAWGLARDNGDAGNRALAGAAAGGAAGLVRGSLRTGEPSGTYRGFVNRCLAERGYDVIGWQ